ncbi:MAG: pirin-like C-terminal cupin domain-containing protein, partial [Bryobacteraceae bacterium]
SAFAYVFEGDTLHIGADVLGLRELGVLSKGDAVELAVPAEAKAARVLLVAGRPLNEPVARYGPFVMNTPEQIVQAMQDYQSGRF